MNDTRDANGKVRRTYSFNRREDDVLDKIWKFILLRVTRAEKAIEKITNSLGPKFTEEMLEVLLEGMSIMFCISREFRKNIENFEGRYVFKSINGDFAVSATFKNGRMKARRGVVDNPNITVNFKNSHALLNFLFSPKPDVLGAMLNQDVVLDGNLNYLYKFAYMANHVRLKGPELLENL
jgi:hypothetical protein